MPTFLVSSPLSGANGRMGGTRVKVGIIGAGALGSAIGGTLVQAGHDVPLVNRDRTHVEAINRNGLVMRADGKDRVVSILIGLVGRDRVIAGKTYIGGAMLGPGHVIAGVRGKETIIGELDGRITPRIERIRAAFQAAGMPLVV